MSEKKEPSEILELLGVFAVLYIGAAVLGVGMATGIDGYMKYLRKESLPTCPTGYELIVDTNDGGAVKCLEK